MLSLICYCGSLNDVIFVGLLIIVGSCIFFFSKQKTAYEMRISYWSSDVCSSDLESGFHGVADLVTEHVWLYDTGRAEERDELPEDIAEREHEEHDQLVEDVVEQDDSLLERYLEGEQPTAEELERALRPAERRGGNAGVGTGSSRGRQDD